jgi:hypothetical protein
MSAVVKTITPFIDRELLLKSLEDLAVKYVEKGNDIVTERTDFYGKQKFVLEGGRYQFQHDSSAEMTDYPWRRLNMKKFKTVTSFLTAVEEKYLHFYEVRMEELERQRKEEELIRIENERKAFVHSQKEAILARAKESGYSVKEDNVKGKIRLVLVRNTYTK